MLVSCAVVEPGGSGTIIAYHGFWLLATKLDLEIAFYVMFFFFSSRRRHTRCSRDWSSDVCSSDLKPDTLLFNIWTACVAFLMVTLLKRSVSGFAGRLGVTTASSLVKPSVLFANVLTKACPAWPDFDPMIRSM